MTHFGLETDTLLSDLPKRPSFDALLFLLHYCLADGQSTGNPRPHLPPLQVDNHPNLGFQYLRLEYFEQRVQFLLASQHSEVMRGVTDCRIERGVRIQVELFEQLEVISFFVGDLLLQQFGELEERRGGGRESDGFRGRDEADVGGRVRREDSGAGLASAKVFLGHQTSDYNYAAQGRLTKQKRFYLKASKHLPVILFHTYYTCLGLVILNN